MRYIVTIEQVKEPEPKPLVDIILVRAAIGASIVVLILGLIIDLG